MDRGMYASASGGLLADSRIEIVANNLANVNTVGFKAQRLRSREESFDDTLASETSGKVTAKAKADHDRTPGVVGLSTYTDFSPGPIAPTENPLDVALREEKQFFAIQTPSGEAYTKAGNFSLRSDGTLVTQDNMPVMGDSGPIVLPPGNAHISTNGSVVVGNQTAGRLKVVEIDDLSKLNRTESSRFTLPSGAGAARPVEADVVPGSVELPNVNVVDAMIEMISAQKGFEAYTKTLRSIDELNEVAIRNARATG